MKILDWPLYRTPAEKVIEDAAPITVYNPIYDFYSTPTPNYDSCPYCGSGIIDDSTNCNQCGAPVISRKKHSVQPGLYSLCSSTADFTEDE